MIVALILLAAIVTVGAGLYAEHRFHLSRMQKSTPEGEKAPESENTVSQPEEECCGMHITCERDSLLASVSPEIVYYDDEELDVYAGKSPADYSDEEIEQFRDILLTTRPEDIAGWGRSLQLRGISLPDAVRDELIMIVSEARIAAVNPSHNA